MFKPKRLTLTLNSRQVADAQIIAALELIGGESTSAIKALALRGIMSDSSMSSVLAHGVAIMSTARKSKGSGWKPGKDWNPSPTEASPTTANVDGPVPAPLIAAQPIRSLSPISAAAAVDDLSDFFSNTLTSI